ncbi:saccharopine dehydrogenase NADP-binding domain-containing protein [Myxococcota bacterium]|nr:saccharopine dehydrogenase NADP-binding domain-containing protein [Myxococcota bacterium]
MGKIFVIGAGRSASTLIRYLLENAEAQSWEIRVGDINLELAKQKIAGHPRGQAVLFDSLDRATYGDHITWSDLVISMLPASMHVPIARECIDHGKHLLTASYISDEMQELHAEAQKAGVLLLNEMGLDPGIDHMSAMRMLDKLREQGVPIVRFESFAGGLLAPQSEANNPWRYKFTWNPRNVVLAGSGSAVKFVQEDRYKYIPYQRLFRRTEIIEIEGYGKFEGYANRDSLKYIDVYRLRGIPTIYRGTLRRPGFCKAWDVFVQLGATDDSYLMEGSEDMTCREFIDSFLLYDTQDSTRLRLMHYLRLDHDSPEMEKLDWLGIFDDTPIGYGKPGTPAQLLQHILEKKWNLEPDDKDMIVMVHKIHFLDSDAKRHQLFSSTAILGEDRTYTAMAHTVGLPLGIAARLILNRTIQLTGVQRPTLPAIYHPVLQELERYGITFHERETAVQFESMY